MFYEYCPECGFKNAGNKPRCSQCGAEMEKADGDTQEMEEESHGDDIVRAPEDLSTDEADTAKMKKGADTRKIDETKLLFGKYAILGEISRSRRGALYKVEDRETGKLAAIKEIESGLPHGPKRDAVIRDFYDLVNRLKSLKHPGTANVLDGFQEGEKFYVIKEFVDGETLHDTMKKRLNHPLEQELVVKWTERILEALDALHNLTPPWIVRDLGPTNIMVDVSNNVYIVDLGLDWSFSTDSDHRKRDIPGFMAPELASGKVDPRTDIFSLGKIIRYLMTGIDPSDEKNRYRRYKRIKDINSKVSKWFDDVVLEMVEREPDNRITTAAEALREIREKSAEAPPVHRASKPAVTSEIPPAAKTPEREMAPLSPLPPPAGQKKKFGDLFSMFMLIAIIAIPVLIGLGIFFVPWYLNKAAVDRGISACRSGQYQEAVEILQEAAKKNRKNPEIFFYLGESFYGGKNYDGAIENYKQAIDMDSSYEDGAGEKLALSYYERGLTRAASGDVDGAFRDLQEAYKLKTDLADPSDPVFIYYQGLNFHREKKFQKAVDEYTKALKLKKSADFYMARAEAYLALNNSATALEDLKSTMKLEPDKKIFIHRKMEILVAQLLKNADEYMKAEKVDEALQALTTANKIKEGADAAIKSKLAEAYLKKGQDCLRQSSYEAALEALETGSQHNPNNGNIYFTMAEASQALGMREHSTARLEKAIAYFQKALGSGVETSKIGVINHRIKYLNERIAYYKTRGVRSATTTTEKPISRKGMQQFYVYSGNFRSGFITLQNKGSTFLLKGSDYLSCQKWYWGKRAGNQVTLYVPYGSGGEKPYVFNMSPLEQITVVLVTKSGYRMEKRGKRTARVRQSGKVTLRSSNGGTFFVEGRSAERYLEQGKTYYGTSSPSEVSIYMGKDYSTRRSFDIKGFGGVY